MRVKRYASVATLSALLIGAMIFAGGCGWLPSMEDILDRVPDAAEETLAPDEGEPVSDEAEEDPQPEADEPDDEEATDPSRNDAEGEVMIDDWYNPREISDLLDTFERLEWIGTDVDDGAEGEPTPVRYRVEGVEQVEGAEATRVSLSLDEDRLEVWLDEDREVVQARVNEDMVPSMALDSMLSPMLEVAFAPFAVMERIDVEGLLRGSGDYGWDWEVIDSAGEQIGDMRAEVTTIRVDVGPPYVPEGEEAWVECGVADFGDFQMLVQWEHKEATASEEYGITLEVQELVPR